MPLATLSPPSTTALPVIDISPTNPLAASQLLEAATKHGFLYVANNAATGIFSDDIDSLFKLSKAFFDSPVEIKRECERGSDAEDGNRGWVGMGGERLAGGKKVSPALPLVLLDCLVKGRGYGTPICWKGVVFLPTTFSFSLCNGLKETVGRLTPSHSYTI